MPWSICCQSSKNLCIVSESVFFSNSKHELAEAAGEIKGFFLKMEISSNFHGKSYLPIR